MKYADACVCVCVCVCVCARARARLCVRVVYFIPKYYKNLSAITKIN